MDANELKNWLIENNIEEKTKRNFEECFNSFRETHPDQVLQHFGEFDEKLFKAKMYEVSLKIRDWSECTDAFVVTFTYMDYADEEIGVYKSYFDFNGNDLDDAFTLYTDHYFDKD